MDAASGDLGLCKDVAGEMLFFIENNFAAVYPAQHACCFILFYLIYLPSQEESYVTACEKLRLHTG